MQWALDNWIWILLGGGLIAMHLFGHGHGGHGRGKDAAKADPATPDNPPPSAPEAEARAGKPAGKPDDT